MERRTTLEQRECARIPPFPPSLSLAIPTIAILPPSPRISANKQKFPAHSNLRAPTGEKKNFCASPFPRGRHKLRAKLWTSSLLKRERKRRTFNLISGNKRKK